MRIIRRTFSNLNKSTLFLGKAGENLVTRLEIDVSKELSEYENPSFDLILSMPSEDVPYPVLANLSGSKLNYTFTENDLSKAGKGQIEALVSGANGEVLKSTTAKTVIDHSINPNTYPGPIQRFLEQLENNVRDIVMQYNIEVVDALPSTTRAGKIVYLIGSGFYYYSDGQWNSISSGGSAESDIVVARSLSDLEGVTNSKIVFVPQTIEESDETFAAGVYLKDNQDFVLISVLTTEGEKATFIDAAQKKHTHSNKPSLDKFDDVDGEAAYDGTVIASAASKAAWNDAAQKKHTHSNKTVLDKFSEENGVPKYDGNPIGGGETPDTLVPLSLGTTYPSLSVRSDWQDVPVYNTGANEAVAALSDANGDNYLSLMYLTDEVTGMPCPLLQVSVGGVWYNCYGTTYHDIGMVTRQAGWYTLDQMEYIGTAPVMENISFASLIVYNDGTPTQTEYDTLDDLPADAQCALETLSRIFNVSVDAMGDLGTKPDGVQRLTPVPQTGRRYAFATGDDITFPLPQIAWTGEEREFWLDLNCTSSIDLTLADTVAYEDGNNIDTTRGNHRLHFYVPAGAEKWTVAETESVTEITEDVVPEYAIPFRSCTDNQLRAVLKYGYVNGDGAWCVRRNGVEVEFFHVGDTRMVTLTGGQEVTMRIIGVYHDDLPLGGKAALTCDFKELIPVDSYVVNQGGYSGSQRQRAAKSIASLLPDSLKEIIVPVVKIYSSSGFSVTDAFWLFSSAEVGLTSVGGEAYPVFTDNVSRARKNISGVYADYVLRTNNTLQSSISGTDKIYADGSGNRENNGNYSVVAVGFCLNA